MKESALEDSTQNGSSFIDLFISENSQHKSELRHFYFSGNNKTIQFLKKYGPFLVSKG